MAYQTQRRTATLPLGPNPPSETTVRYQTGAPPVKFGTITRNGTDIAGGAERHDIYRDAYAAERPPIDSPFNLERQHYKRLEDRARQARTNYWNHYDNTSNPKYHQRGQSYAHHAAIQTQQATDARQDFMHTYPGYDQYSSFQGHVRRVEVLREKEAEMRDCKQYHRGGCQQGK